MIRNIIKINLNISLLLNLIGKKTFFSFIACVTKKNKNSIINK